MTHHASRNFWEAYDALPAETRDLADKNFARLKANPEHPSLKFKSVGSYWSARVGLRYRALAVKQNGDYIWFWIGSHADYDRLLAP